MSSIAFVEVTSVFDAVDVLFDKIDALDSDVLSNSERAELLERRQTWRRRLPAGDYELINHLATASADELGGTLSHVLADRLRITRAEARRRIDEATDLGPRRALTGEPLAPKLEHTAAGQRAGLIGVEHVRIIRRFFAQLPHFVDEPTRADAECKLAEVASQYRPDELQRFADHYELVLNPDGRRRGHFGEFPRSTGGDPETSGHLHCGGQQCG
jgi:hypothetical protein